MKAAGAKSVLTKPISKAEIISALTEVMNDRDF
jgi:CheY-like chemotaxis protein